MPRSPVNAKTIIEMRLNLRKAMSGEPFPCCLVAMTASEEGTPVDRFLQHRSDARWVLIGQHAVQSHVQLWTAWIQAARNELRNTMVARSVDAEFLRYLAGTHHISEAFSRAGVGAEDGLAWVVWLPQAEGEANDLGHLQPKAVLEGTFDDGLASLLSSLSWSKDESEASPSIEGMKRLGIDVEGWAEERLEEAILAHVLMADDQSSSHR